MILLLSGEVAKAECETFRNDYSEGCKAAFNVVSPIIFTPFFVWDLYVAWVLYQYMNSTNIESMSDCCTSQQLKLEQYDAEKVNYDAKLKEYNQTQP